MVPSMYSVHKSQRCSLPHLTNHVNENGHLIRRSTRIAGTQHLESSPWQRLTVQAEHRERIQTRKHFTSRFPERECIGYILGHVCLLPHAHTRAAEQLVGAVYIFIAHLTSPQQV